MVLFLLDGNLGWFAFDVMSISLYFFCLYLEEKKKSKNHLAISNE
jgi:hypothetical protein